MPQDYPQDFYHQEKYTAQVFTAQPTGKIVPERLIRQKADFWEMPGYAQQLTPKTLIYADWRRPLKHNERDRREKLTQLLNDGFQVYVWMNETFEVLTPDDIVSFKFNRVAKISGACPRAG